MSLMSQVEVPNPPLRFGADGLRVTAAKAEAHDLVAIYDALQDELWNAIEAQSDSDKNRLQPSGFYWNREQIVHAFKQNRLYIAECWKLDEPALRSRLTKEQQSAMRGGLLHSSSFYSWQVPAFVVVSEDDRAEALLLWVHKAWRRSGVARDLIDNLGIESANVIQESQLFWERIGFKPTGKKLGELICMKREPL